MRRPDDESFPCDTPHHGGKRLMSVLLPFILMLLLLHAATVPRACAAQDTGDATIAPDYLRCEYLVDPLGIDVVSHSDRQHAGGPGA
jgi:hypothetical protein